MQARYCDPIIGWFYSNDPVGFTGEVDTFNRYSYVANNPYRYTDPTGESKDGGSASELAGVVLDFVLGDEHKNDKNRLAIENAKQIVGGKGSAKQSSRAKRRASRSA